MVPGLYPEIAPLAEGVLEVGDRHAIYWETCGNPRGKPAVVLHGGPGSGCTAWHRRLFDPESYRVVLFDQRGCGRSVPHAGDTGAALTHNTTWHLVADLERLRQRLGIERWLVFGGSWGSTLALAYAERFPARVTEMVLWGVTTGRRAEFDWLFRGGVARFFPGEWHRLRSAVAAAADSDRDVVDACARLLDDPDPAVRRRAAFEWCLWESATPTWPPAHELRRRFADPRFAMGFARIVTHYVRHDAWIEDESLLRGAAALAGIPGRLVNGGVDFQAPLGNAWELARVWPNAELVVVYEAGHAPDHPAVTRELVRATDAFAARR